MNDAIRKAETLIEALGYIRQFRNRLIVIKLGGSAMEEPDALKATLRRRHLHGHRRPAADPRPRRRQADRPRDGRLRAEAAQGPGPALHRRRDAGHRGARPAQGDQRRHRDSRFAGSAAGPSGRTSDRCSCSSAKSCTLPGPDGQPIDLGRVGKVTRVDADLLARFLRGGDHSGHPVAGARRARRLAERQRRHRRRRRRRPAAGREAGAS